MNEVHGPRAEEFFRRVTQQGPTARRHETAHHIAVGFDDHIGRVLGEQPEPGLFGRVGCDPSCDVGILPPSAFPLHHREHGQDHGERDDEPHRPQSFVPTAVQKQADSTTTSRSRRELEAAMTGTISRARQGACCGDGEPGNIRCELPVRRLYEPCTIDHDAAVCQGGTPVA